MSYALWQLVLKQKNENIVSTGCFKINFTDKNEIQLNIEILNSTTLMNHGMELLSSNSFFLLQLFFLGV